MVPSTFPAAKFLATEVQPGASLMDRLAVRSRSLSVGPFLSILAARVCISTAVFHALRALRPTEISFCLDLTTGRFLPSALPDGHARGNRRRRYHHDGRRH
jgi:hypothetical protein